jgi:hypothetical protein
MESIVLVEWVDAHQETSSWTAIEDLDSEGDRLIRTVGFLLPVDDGGKSGHVTIVQSWDEEQEMVDNVLHIPVGMVRKMSAVTFGGAIVV